MKHIILTSLALLSVITFIKAEEQNSFSFSTTIGMGITMNTPSYHSIKWQAIGYYNPTERLSVGMGTGLSFYEKILIPIYGDINFQIGRERIITPFIELAAGYSFALSKDAVGGCYLNPSIGIQHTLKKRMKLHLALGYESQNLKRVKKHSDEYFLKEFEEQLSHKSISLKFGVISKF